MIELEKEFTSGEDGNSANPRLFTQVKRSTRTAIYHRTVKASGKDEGYEVFRIKIEPKGKKIFATVLEDDREKYPTASEFGIRAWAVNELKRAKEIFDRLEKEADEKENPVEDKPIVIPVGEFTVGELAAKNENMDYGKAFLFVKDALGNGTIKFLREERRAAKGKASKIYQKA